MYSVPLSSLKSLNDQCQLNNFRDTNSTEYRLDSIIMDIAYHRLYKPVRTTTVDNTKRSFFKLKFLNKGIDAINMSNIMHHKNVKSKIPNYFKDCETPIISYSYTRSIAYKIFNYKQTLKDMNFNDSAFIHQPHGHVITGDLSIFSNTKLRELLSKGPKYREPKSFTWRYKF